MKILTCFSLLHLAIPVISSGRKAGNRPIPDEAWNPSGSTLRASAALCSGTGFHILFRRRPSVR